MSGNTYTNKAVLYKTKGRTLGENSFEFYCVTNIWIKIVNKLSASDPFSENYRNLWHVAVQHNGNYESIII